MDFIR
jgi:hypothetical protein